MGYNIDMKKLSIFLMILTCGFVIYLLNLNLKNAEIVNYDEEEIKEIEEIPEPITDLDELAVSQEENEKYSFKFTYPKTGIEIRDKYIEESLSKKKTAFLGSVSSAELPFQNRKYQQETEYKKYVSEGYTSYTFSTYEDMGGAHSNGYISSVTFDESDNIISLSDFLFKKYGGSVTLEDITTLVRPRLISMLGENLDLKWMQSGTEPKPENYSTFVIDGDGIRIFFQYYQIGAYFIGSPEVYISFSEIQ